MKDKQKPPHPIDLHVGGRVRLRRMMVGMSQGKLAKALGIAFQQVQKYEKGMNRIGAGRLWDISRVLDVPVSFFYEDLSSPDGDNNKDSPYGGASAPKRVEIYYPPESLSRMTNFMTSREGYHLVRAFTGIESVAVRKRIIDLVRVLGGSSDDDSDSPD